MLNPYIINYYGLTLYFSQKNWLNDVKKVHLQSFSDLKAIKSWFYSVVVQLFRVFTSLFWKQRSRFLVGHRCLPGLQDFSPSDQTQRSLRRMCSVFASGCRLRSLSSARILLWIYNCNLQLGEDGNVGTEGEKQEKLIHIALDWGRRLRWRTEKNGFLVNGDKLFDVRLTKG